MRRALTALTLLALTLPSAAMARGDYHPEDEFQLHDWVPIHLGSLNLSINKAVAYVWLGGLLTMLFGVAFMRLRLKMTPDRRQTLGEAAYDAIQTQIAEQGLPTKAIGRWFPFVA